MTAPAPRHASGAYRICMVCLGNICRSPMAEVILREELERAGLSGRVEVDSAGTGDWHLGSPMDPRARAELSGAVTTEPGTGRGSSSRPGSVATTW